MKTLKYAFLGLVFIGLSCEEDDLFDSLLEYQQQLAEYYLDSEAALSNVYTIVDLTVRNPQLMAGDTITTLGAQVYMNGGIINIDYGNGATAPDGITRSGLIMVNQTGDYTAENGVLDISFDNYVVDNNPVGGTLKVTNTGNNELTLDVQNFSANNDFSLTANKTLKWNAGFDTDMDSDDEFTLSGTAVGTDSASNSVNTDILTPLVFRRNCEYAVVSGVIDLGFDIDTASSSPTGTLDFIADDGINGCENLVNVQLIAGEQ